AEVMQQRLEGLIRRAVERSRVTKCIVDRVSGIEGQARHPAVRNGRGRRMRALVPEEVREHMRMWSFWRCLAVTRNALIDLEPCKTADEGPVRTERRHDLHERVVRRKERAAETRP